MRTYCGKGEKIYIYSLEVKKWCLNNKEDKKLRAGS